MTIEHVFPNERVAPLHATRLYNMGENQEQSKTKQESGGSPLKEEEESSNTHHN